MTCFLMAKITVFFVENFANSSLLPSIIASNTIILSHQKFNSDLIRGSLKQGQQIPPILRLGFRPFFLFGSMFALLSMAIWLLTLKGTFSPVPFNGLVWWHSHEMLFGFVTAIIVGFLLTAVQNWTAIPGVRGVKLAALFAIWLSARLLIFFNPTINLIIIMLIDLAFLPLAALLLGYPLLKIRQYRNMIFIPLLLLMTLSNLLTYLPQFGFNSNLNSA
jgi:uncharacterized protein involved in response to NO